MKQVLAVFLICLGAYSLTNYGGVRSPDSEVVFRVAESLADGRGFAPKDLESWPGFGVSRGTGGNLYSVYPPMESLVFAPAVKLGRWINQSHWYEGRRIPLSHYVGSGLNNVIFGIPEQDLRPHALRYAVSWLDVLVSALVAAAFYGVLLLLTGSGSASLVVALFYALGTLAWPYAGSFFSEPLALLFVLISFYGMLVLKPAGSPDPSPAKAQRPGTRWAVASGVALGLAAATHPTAILFAPFFAGYLAWPGWMGRPGSPDQMRSPGSPGEPGSPGSTGSTGSTGRSRGGAALAGCAWCPVIRWLLGLGVVLLALGVFNHARFGSFLESGRGLSAANKAEFVSPLSAIYWHNLYSVLLAPGKGLLLFCPAVVLGLVAWRRFHRAAPALSVTLASAIVVRLLFNASYRDWHAGFSLGPRYMLLVIPLLLVPVAFWLRDAIGRRAWKAAAGAVAVMCLCVVQQLYFALGEIFSYYHLQSFSNIRRGIETVQSQRIYQEWSLSPLIHLHEFRRGPFLLQSLGISNLALWLTAGAILIAAICVAGLVALRRRNINRGTHH